MNNAASLKARIRNLAQEKSIPAQIVLQNYMFERLLVRLSLSDYKDRFVLKGGILVAAIVGLDNRATMDMDTTIRNLPLTPYSIHKALEMICDIHLNDNVSFELGTVSPIREDDIYGGFRVSLKARFDTIVVPLSIDVTAGDAVTPHPVQYEFTELFDGSKTFELWAYNIETILAEKIETILRRGVFNTRPRDYYDAYILITTQQFNEEKFLKALKATSIHRNTNEQIKDVNGILESIENSREMNELWNKYRKQFHYAAAIEFGQIVDAVRKVLRMQL